MIFKNYDKQTKRTPWKLQSFTTMSHFAEGYLPNCILQNRFHIQDSFYYYTSYGHEVEFFQ